MGFAEKMFKGDRTIWLIFALLSIVSVIEFFSSSSALSYKSADHWTPLSKHILMIFLGFIAMLIVQTKRVNDLKFYLVFLLGPVAILTLLWVSLKGGEINGASRWLSIPGTGFTFQPSELAKMWLISFTAFVLHRNNRINKKRNDYKALIIIGGATLLTTGLILRENFSTALLLAATIFIMLILGRIKAKYLITIVTGASLLVACGYLALRAYPDQKLFHRGSTWMARIDQMGADEKVPPAMYDMDKNAQRGHASIAITKGGLLGVGPGNSVQRDFLSHAYSDLIFAIILEEFGLLGGGFIIYLYLLLLFRVANISRRTDSIFATLLIQGLVLIIFLQAMINIMVAVDIIPITGQPLPFISKGGSSMIINSVALGVILSVSYKREKTTSAEEETKDKVETEITNSPNSLVETQARLENR